MTSTAAQEFWNRLPEAERERRREYYDRTARRAYSHCCSILIGCAREPTCEARSCTGILACIEGQHYLLTANHVLDGFAKKLEAGAAHFQIGDLILNPWSRLAYQDKESDLAALALDSRELPAVGSKPYEPTGPWPPLAPKNGDFVHLCGFAKANRRNGANATIDTYSLHLFGRVLTRHDGNFYAQIDRTGIPTENAALMPAAGDGFGGMSGGPVMLHFDEPLPLVGVISEMSDIMDAILVSSLSNSRLQRRVTVSLPA